MLHIPSQCVSYKLHNFVKVYPDFARYYELRTPVECIIDGWETEKHDKKGSKTPQIKPDSLIKSIARTKTVISDIVLSNRFEYFVTFTFARDRQDILLCKERLTFWLNNCRKKYGDFEYLLVPEWHKKKDAIHFHGLFKNFNVPLLDSGKKIKGRKAFNIPSYKLGFSTAVQMDSSPRTASYIKKYVTKEIYEETKTKNSKRYWVSRNLQRPKKIHNVTITETAKSHLTPSYSFDNLTIYTIPATLTLQTKDKGQTWKISTTLSKA